MRNEGSIIQGSKAVLAMITGLFAYLVNAITELIIVLAFLMIIDYATGMIASFIQKEWDSSKGFRGIIKKVGYIFLILISLLTDYVITYITNNVGLSFGFLPIFTFAVSCWLIGTELLSITENLGKMGVPIPNFLKNAFIKLKDVSEKLGEENNEVEE